MTGMDLRQAFNNWGDFTDGRFADKQWLLAKWEVCEGVSWPEEKISAMLDLIAGRLDLGLNDSFADLGCGGGWMLKRFAPDVGRAVGLDFSWQMLSNAVSIDAGDSLVQGEIGRLPFKDNSFDKILCYFVLINIMDDEAVERFILDMMRVLKSGGKLLIGQMPDKARSGDYDAAKEGYIEFCRQAYDMGHDLRDINRMPQKLFDVPLLTKFLDAQGFRYQKMTTFNPFYRPGVSREIDWRFDILLEK